MRSEAEMHAIWNALRFDRAKLTTTNGQIISILNPGEHNHDQGPDFLNATIEVDGIRMSGHIELHLNSNQWYSHGHHFDFHYNPVVLHVVLKTNGKPILRQDGTQIPEIAIGDRLLGHGIIKPKHKSPCFPIGKTKLPSQPEKWLEELGMQRLERKAKILLKELHYNRNDWSQSLWKGIASTLGGQVNGVQFSEIAKIANWNLIRKYTFSSQMLEAMLFGIAGQLESRTLDSYQESLKTNWEFLKAKHQLIGRTIPLKFHRMRPASMPLGRISQLASIAQNFSPICQLISQGMPEAFLHTPISGSNYWKKRISFGSQTINGNFELGYEMRKRIYVNILHPMQFLLIRTHNPSYLADSHFQKLTEFPPEHNQITRKLGSIGLIGKNALQSQGIIELDKTLCQQSRCFDCKIGSKILTPNRTDINEFQQSN